MLARRAITEFHRDVYDHYRRHGRDLPWRRTIDPYHIFVSEVMLQQTPVERVLKKYPQFTDAFPNWQSLARATLRQVLTVWQGMGYNRRALYLRQTAAIIIQQHRGRVPRDPSVLEQLPGIGPYTARAIGVFAFNQPAVLIETNIRAVFIDHFFPNKKQVADKEIVPLIAAALDQKNPRRWYLALMDYGAMLKRTLPNPGRRSAHVFRQSRFVGSDRQARGLIVKTLLVHPRLTITQLQRRLSGNRRQIERVAAGLKKDGLIEKRGGVLTMA